MIHQLTQPWTFSLLSALVTVFVQIQGRSFSKSLHAPGERFPGHIPVFNEIVGITLTNLGVLC